MADISGKDLAYRALASVLGGPVDLTSMVMRPFGYDVEKPVLGSEWIGSKLEQGGLVSEARDPLKEFAASVMVPSPGGLAAGIGKGAALLPAIAGMTKAGKVEDALKGVGKVADEASYYYHGTPMANVKSIEESGLSGGLSGMTGLTSAGPEAAKGWVKAMQRGQVKGDADVALVRVKKNAVTPDLVDQNEVFVRSGVPREAIEISKDGGKTWFAPGKSLPTPKVSPRQVPPEEAVMNYVLGEATPWNEALRTGRWDVFVDDTSPQGLAETIGNIQAFDKYLAKGMKANGQQLNRVVDASYDFSGKNFDALKVGDTFVDPGFVSTTTSKKYAEHVASNTDQPRLFRIKLPTSGKVPARRIRDEELDPDNFAKEITLGRDQKFKVVGKTEENGLPVVILELQAK